MKNDPAPMNGQELFNVLYGSQFRFDKEKVPEEINVLREKIMKEYEENEKMPKKKRILLTGCPSSGAPMKVVKALEENGAVVVAYENCGGTKSVDRLIDESAEDIYEAIAERYLQIGCSVMTPNKNRYELIGRLIEEYQILIALIILCKQNKMIISVLSSCLFSIKSRTRCQKNA